MSGPTILGSLLLSSLGAVASGHRSMRWLFTRDDQTIELEARGEGHNRFIAAVRWPNNGQEVRQFFSIDSMLLHLLALTRQFRNSDFTFKEACIEDVQNHCTSGTLLHDTAGHRHGGDDV
jgi:hypothetical protein